jgi:predicted secreted protein
MPAGAQTTPAPNNSTVIELAAEASRSAPNDLGRAVLYAEGSDENLPALSRKLNQQIAAALAVAKTYANVKTHTGSTQTWPTYARNSTKIESWRMRSEIVLESRETAPLSELVGKLQATGLALGNIGFQPAPETKKKVEDDTIVDAIAAFRARADVAAGALGRKYRIKQIAINTSSMPPRPYYPMAKAAMSADAAPAPTEAGESQVGITVTGQIELQ